MAQEIKDLVEGIQKSFNDFKSINDERLSKVEKGASGADFEAKLAKVQADISTALDLKKEIERVEAKQNLQGLMGNSDENADKKAYKSAFIDGFLRKGNEIGLKDLQAKAMSVGTPADGGFALPEQIDRLVEQLARDMSAVRSVANVIQVGTSDYKKLVNVNGIASGWVGETAARPATNTSQLAEVAPPMGTLYANPQVTQDALDDLFYNVESDVAAQLAEEFGIAEGAAFVSGNGTNKPKGFLAYTTAATADSARAFGTIEHVATGVAGDFAAANKADVLYDVIGKLKDTTGQYLWQPSLQEGFPIRLLGFGVVEAEDMPSKAANALAIAFGNFKRGYTIVDRFGTRMLRDPYTNKPYVGFYTTRRVGGAVVNSEAIKVVKFAAA